jgi:hypothetical protein
LSRIFHCDNIDSGFSRGFHRVRERAERAIGGAASRHESSDGGD